MSSRAASTWLFSCEDINSYLHSLEECRAAYPRIPVKAAPVVEGERAAREQALAHEEEEELDGPEVRGTEEKDISSGEYVVISPAPVLLCDRQPPSGDDWLVHVRDDVRSTRSGYDTTTRDIGIDDAASLECDDPFAPSEGTCRYINQAWEAFPAKVASLLEAGVPVSGISVNATLRTPEAAGLARVLESIFSDANTSTHVSVRIASSKVDLDRIFASCADLSKLHTLVAVPNATGGDTQTIIGLCRRAMNLKRLHISGKGVCGVVAAPSFGSYLQSPGCSLEWLTIHGAGGYDSDIYLQILESNVSRIKYLNISSGGMLSHGMDGVIEKLSCARMLCEVHLDNYNAMEPEDYDALGRALGSLDSSLRTVHLGRARGDAETRNELMCCFVKGILARSSSEPATVSTKCIGLYLENFDFIEVSCIVPLVEHQGAVALSHLELNGNDFSGSNDFEDFALSVSRCKHLKHLSLQRCGLDEYHVFTLCIALRVAWSRSCRDIREAVLKSSSAGKEQPVSSHIDETALASGTPLASTATITGADGSDSTSLLHPSRSDFISHRWVVDESIIDALTPHSTPSIGFVQALMHVPRIMLSTKSIWVRQDMILLPLLDRVLDYTSGGIFGEYLQQYTPPSTSQDESIVTSWVRYVQRVTRENLDSRDTLFVDFDKEAMQCFHRPIGPMEVAQSDAVFGKYSNLQRDQLARVSSQYVYPRLSVLDVNNNGIGVLGALHIVDLIMSVPTHPLRQLDLSGCHIGAIGSAALCLALRGDALVERVRMSARDVWLEEEKAAQAEMEAASGSFVRTAGISVFPAPSFPVGRVSSTTTSSSSDVMVPKFLDLTVPRPHRASLSVPLYSSPWPTACKVALALALRQSVTGGQVPTDVMISIYEFLRVPIVRTFELTCH